MALHDVTLAVPPLLVSLPSTARCPNPTSLPVQLGHRKHTLHHRLLYLIVPLPGILLSQVTLSSPFISFKCWQKSQFCREAFSYPSIIKSPVSDPLLIIYVCLY